jgi:hypothetical protein
MKDKHVDQAIGAFCKAIQTEIEGLPFLTPDQKHKAKGWLDECAESAKDSDNKLGAFNQGLQGVQSKLRSNSGVSLPKSALSNGDVNAFAYSGGNAVIFGLAGSSDITAHELTHVVQQRG